MPDVRLGGARYRLLVVSGTEEISNKIREKITNNSY